MSAQKYHIFQCATTCGRHRTSWRNPEMYPGCILTTTYCKTYPHTNSKYFAPKNVRVVSKGAMIHIYHRDDFFFRNSYNYLILLPSVLNQNKKNATTTTKATITQTITQANTKYSKIIVA